MAHQRKKKKMMVKIMKSYEYLVNDEFGNTLGVFDGIQNAVIFIKALLYEKYDSEDNLKLTIVRQEKE